jgi:hypothetical protein
MSGYLSLENSTKQLNHLNNIQAIPNANSGTKPVWYEKILSVLSFTLPFASTREHTITQNIHHITSFIDLHEKTNSLSQEVLRISPVRDKVPIAHESIDARIGQLKKTWFSFFNLGAIQELESLKGRLTALSEENPSISKDPVDAIGQLFDSVRTTIMNWLKLTS